MPWGFRGRSSIGSRGRSKHTTQAWFAATSKPTVASGSSSRRPSNGKLWGPHTAPRRPGAGPEGRAAQEICRRASPGSPRNDLAAMGYGIIMVSSEMAEVLGMSDRIVVMKEGRVDLVMAGAMRVQKEGLEEVLSRARRLGLGMDVGDAIDPSHGVLVEAGALDAEVFEHEAEVGEFLRKLRRERRGDFFAVRIDLRIGVAGFGEKIGERLHQARVERLANLVGQKGAASRHDLLDNGPLDREAGQLRIGRLARNGQAHPPGFVDEEVEVKLAVEVDVIEEVGVGVTV